MTEIVYWLEHLFGSIPLPLLEVWGHFAYLVGFALAICAYGGFTFRVGTRWQLGRERQAWDAKAILAISVTFVVVVVTGYLGSFIVLIPGAQTLESLKDLAVFVCILLFGYPALLAIPFAYGLSDVLEGVPPSFVLDWLPGYFINPACFWVAYQLFGKDPDFRRARTWGLYLLFVLVFMSLEPVLWGHICADKFTAEMSYRGITSALVFTTSITWLAAPVAMLVALPTARKLGLFWAEIPDHVRERALGSPKWRWQAGRPGEPAGEAGTGRSLPLRMFLLTPFIAFVLVMVGLTATVTLMSAERDAGQLAMTLQDQVAQNLQLRLDRYLDSAPAAGEAARRQELGRLLGALDLPLGGRALVVERSGRVVASSEANDDPVLDDALTQLRGRSGSLAARGATTELRFNHVTRKPLWRDTWLLRAVAYQHGAHTDWLLVTAIPEQSFLTGVKAGRSRSALVFAMALLLSLAIAVVLAAAVAEPLRSLARAARALARGSLTERVPVSRLAELGTLAHAFNDMAARLKSSFDDLVAEVEMRTQRGRELQESEARVRVGENRMQLAVKAGKLGVWDWDVGHDKLIWDDAMYRLYGVRREDFGGAFEAWSRCLMPEDLVQARRDVDAALRGERDFSSDFRVRWPDGSIHHLKGVAQTVFAEDGRALRMVGINWDVTEQLHAEQELRRHRDHLEELVAERTAALSVAVGQAEAANRAKSAFLANMSHEIRTPMNAILGYAQLLQREGTLAGTPRRWLEAIHVSGEHLLRLINDVLEMSKIEAGRATVVAQPFDLRALLAEVSVMFTGLLDERRIGLSFELDDSLPDVVIADAGKVRQVLINLLSNAAKFTRRGHIRVHAAGQRITPDQLRIEVSVVDTGSGIAPDHLARIFDAFDQVDAGAASGGSGLGLTISRGFARLMHGDLTVTSEPGVGSTFTFSFEARPGAVDDAAAAEPAPLPLALAPEQPRRRILVVDDVATNREIAEEQLTRVGFEVRVAVSGVEALDVHRDWSPDLVLMDLRMPGELDGLEATRRLRGGGSRAVIIACSASALAEAEQAALAAGADAFLRKPYRERELFGRIGDLLGVGYRHEPDRASAPVAARGDEPSLRVLLDAVPADLVARLRDAAAEASAPQLDRLATEVAPHSAAAAARIRALAECFDYDVLLEAVR